MKKFFAFLWLSFSVFAFSQTYHFDYYIERKTDGFPKSRKIPLRLSYFYDSKEIKRNELEQKSNTLYIYSYLYDSKQKQRMQFEQRNNILRAYIYSKNFRHSFKVKEINSEYSFFYTHTNVFNKSGISNSDKKNVIHVSKIDSLNYKIWVYKNDKRKKIEMEATATLEKADADLIDTWFDYSRREDVDNELRKAIGENTNFIIKEHKYSNYSGLVATDELWKIEKTNITIQLPEKLLIKEFDYWGEFSE